MTVMRTKQEKERSREVLGAAHQIGNAQMDPRAEKLIDRLTKERSNNCVWLKPKVAIYRTPNTKDSSSLHPSRDGTRILAYSNTHTLLG